MKKLLKKRESELMIQKTISPPRWKRMLKFRNSLSRKYSGENADGVTLNSFLRTSEDLFERLRYDSKILSVKVSSRKLEGKVLDQQKQNSRRGCLDKISVGNPYTMYMYIKSSHCTLSMYYNFICQLYFTIKKVS